ncbi:MAG: Uma2 family endonuclease [Rhodocyclaceae bacterium]|jgi:Uma2 family endonuclease|nr:Uma2 family endonuclease [Rhodocyclaceae bacterium]MBK6908274.1 Uma2 family endonuclease [Rhodocyclaceae bacterium]
MRWADVLADKSLRDLPYKIELDRWGNIMMSPASNRHGRFQVVIAALLETLPNGRSLIECSVDTPEGVKVADVAWCSDAFFAEHGYETPYTAAPEICVEVRSPSNSDEEMLFKIRLYLAAGAKEVWIVFEDGRTRYFDAVGEHPASAWNIDPTPRLNH